MGGRGGKNAGTWEVTNEEKEGGHMAGGRGEHVKTRCEAHEREPLLMNGRWALVNGDRFIRATIPAFVRFVYLDQVCALARSPLCAVWVTLLNPLENPIVDAQLLGNQAIPNSHRIHQLPQQRTLIVMRRNSAVLPSCTLRVIKIGWV